MTTVFKNGAVYDTDERRFVKKDLLVCDGIIADGTAPADAHLVDCTGLYLLPGMIDVHTHGRAGHDFNTADSAACRAMRRAYAEAGTTTVLATLASAPYDTLLSSIDAINDNRAVEVGLATFAGVHLEGRYLNPKRRGAHPDALLHALDCEELAPLLTAMQPAPVHISAACELDGGEAFVRAALSAGATVSLGHSDATYEEAMQIVSWGVTGFTHTFNAMRPLHHREPGTIAASLLCDTAYSEFICDGEHIHPAMIKLASRLKPVDKFVLITDSMEATGCPDGEYAIAGQPVLVKDGRAVNLEGAIAGSTLDLFRGMVNFMRFTGKTLEEAIPCATVNPAKMIGIDDTVGSLQAGLRADLLMIDDTENPVLCSVWIAGEKI